MTESDILHVIRTTISDHRPPAIRRLRALLLAITLLIAAATHAAAQAPTISPYLGTAFIIALPDTLENKNGGTQLTLQPFAELIIYATEPSDVTVTGPAGREIVRVVPDSSSVVSLLPLFPPGTMPFADRVGVMSDKSVSVEASRPVLIYCRFVTAFGAEMMTPLPIASWGREYRMVGMRNDFLMHVGIDSANEEGFEIGDAPTHGIVIASEDGTRVDLEPTSDVIAFPSVMLDRGDVYRFVTAPRLNNLDTLTRDLTGTRIIADKPVAVISGAMRSAGAGDVELLTSLTANTAKNALAEWMMPVDRLGTTFLYLPMNMVSSDVEEAVRLVAPGPDTVRVATSFGGVPRVIAPGSYIEYLATSWRDEWTPTPFVLQADGPVIAAVVSGAWIEEFHDSAGPGYGHVDSWGTSMTLLPPAEQWLNHGRFRAFALPAAIDQYVLIAAESDARVAVDGEAVTMTPVGTSGYSAGRVKVAPGEHAVFASGGLFGGIIYGVGQGFEAFRVPGMEEEKGPGTAHVTVYEEYLSTVWSTPLAGAVVESPAADTLIISTRESCDSMITTITRIASDPTLLAPLEAMLEPGSVNTAVTIDTIRVRGAVMGYVVVLRPVDPSLDASATLVVRGHQVERRIPYATTPTMITLPDEIDFGATTNAGVEVGRTISFVNRRGFTGSVVSATLAFGWKGFRVDDGGRLPATLRSGDSVTIDLLFLGPLPSTDYVDTLIVTTDCGVYRVLVRGRTSDRPLIGPMPTITGYDWEVRDIGSRNDTLSFAGNVGDTKYIIADVAILGGTGGPFRLIPPLHDAGELEVNTGESIPLGISFQPTAPGIYLDSIVLTSDGGIRVTAPLRGVAIDTVPGATIDVDPLLLDTICAGDLIDTAVMVRNSGPVPVALQNVRVIRSTNMTLLSATLPPVGTMIPVGGSLRIPITLTAPAPGPFEIVLGIETVGGGEGAVLRVAGIAVACASPALVVTDHDYDTIWITTMKRGSVMVMNVGRGDVAVSSVAIVDDAEGSFTLIGPGGPFMVPEGDSVMVAADFRPMTPGLKTADVLFTTEIGELRGHLRGVGKKLVVPAFIRRDYSAIPGQEVAIAIELEPPADTVFPDRIDYRLSFSPDLLDALGVVDTLGALTPLLGEGELSGTVVMTADTNLLAGPLVTFRFLTRLSLMESTELPFTLESGLPWLEFEERPGLFTKLPFCALEQRLFDFTQFGLFIGFPEPNPADQEATFRFTIPFDGETMVVIYDLQGNEVLRPEHALLVAGDYTVAIATRLLPVGTYILRFRSGTTFATRRLDVRR